MSQITLTFFQTLCTIFYLNAEVTEGILITQWQSDICWKWQCSGQTLYPDSPLSHILLDTIKQHGASEEKLP